MAASQAEILNGLSSEEAASLMALAVRISVPKGGVLFPLGEYADRVFVVESGCISLTLPMQIRGNLEDVMIEERMAGETVGWSGLIPPHRFTLKASAPSEASLLALPRVALLEHFAANPAVAARVTRNIAAVIGHRLQVFQAMWLREMQRTIDVRYA